jgi:hypothetical protein
LTNLEHVSLYEILVPTVRQFSPPKFYKLKYHRQWDDKVREICGGLTIMTPVKGQWVAPCGTLFIERMIPVRIACTESQIDQIADFTAEHYSQKAVIYYRISDFVRIKEYHS